MYRLSHVCALVTAVKMAWMVEEGEGKNFWLKVQLAVCVSSQHSASFSGRPTACPAFDGLQ